MLIFIHICKLLQITEILNKLSTSGEFHVSNNKIITYHSQNHDRSGLLAFKLGVT